MTSELVIPDEVEPTIGWRSWAYDANVGLLSPSIGTHWPARAAIEARCRSASFGFTMFAGRLSTPMSHESPDEACMCGIHATASIEQAIDYVGYAGIVGLVKLWGRVVESEWGWRGEYAYPDRLWILNGNQTLADQISREYGIPTAVITRDELLAQADTILPPDAEKIAAYKANNRSLPPGHFTGTPPPKITGWTTTTASTQAVPATITISTPAGQIGHYIPASSVPAPAPDPWRWHLHHASMNIFLSVVNCALIAWNAWNLWR